MSIETRRAPAITLTDAIRRHLKSRLRAALAPVGARVQAVTARLEDVNAGRGGIDKRCRIVATLRRRPLIVAQATKANPYAAIDAAANRLRRAALRTVRRPFARARKNPQRPGALVAA